MNLNRPIFCVGTVRSGSTLMGKCLGAHPDVVYVGFELCPEWCEFTGIEIAAPGSSRRPETGTDFVRCPALSADDATTVRRNRARTGFAKLFTKLEGTNGKRFLNKNPHFWNKLPFLHRIFPDACLIVTARDLKSTVASTKRLWAHLHKDMGVIHRLPTDAQECWSCYRSHDSRAIRDSRSFPGGDIEVIAEYWLRTYERIKRDIRLFDHVTIVDHGAFIRDPFRVLKSVHESCGLAQAAYELPLTIDTSTNDRWPSLLTTNEQKQLDKFIDEHGDRFEALFNY